MSTAGGGVRAIAAAAAEALPREDLQLELMPTRFAPDQVQHEEQRERVRAAGRPIGARNLAQKQAVELIRRLFGDPLVERARWLLHSPESLAVELQCSKLEAFDRQDKIRADLMRYIYAPRAAEDGAGNAVAPTFLMQLGGSGKGGVDAPPWLYEGGPVIEQNQGLSEDAPPVSDAAASDGEGK